MKLRKLLAVGAMLAVALVLCSRIIPVHVSEGPGFIGRQDVLKGIQAIAPGDADAAPAITQALIYAGSPDSNEFVTQWFSIRGASRIKVRLLTGRAAFAVGTDADSLFSDSLANFKVLMSDSIPAAGPWNQTSDSSSVDFAFTYSDTATMLVVSPCVVGKALRSPASGTGQVVSIAPLAPFYLANAIKYPEPDGFFMKRFMAFRITPIRRCTPGPTNACFNRVNGLKNLRVFVYVDKKFD